MKQNKQSTGVRIFALIMVGAMALGAIAAAIIYIVG